LVFDSDDLTGWINIGTEKVVRDRLTEDSDFLCRRHILRGEEAAVLGGPVADQRQLDIGSLNLRLPVLVAGDDLGA